MTDFQNTAAGTTSGTAVTTGNSGGTAGDAFFSVQTTGAAITFDNTHPLHGFNALQIAGNGASGVGYVSYSSLNGTSVRAEAYLYLTALPATELAVIWLSSATSAQATCGILASGKLVQRASGTAGTGNSGTAVIPLNTWVRFEFGVTVNTTTGTMQSAMYSLDSTTALDSLSTTGQNTGSAAIVNARFGNSSTGTNSSTYWLGNLRVGDGSNAFYGPYVAATNVPPSVTGPSTTSITGTTASITFAATDSTGTVSSFACSYQSNTLPSGATAVTPTVGTPTTSGIGTGSASATFPISGLTANARYFFGCTATDSNGGTSTSPVIARVDVTRDAPDIRAVDVVGFTVVGGGAAIDAINAGNAQAAAGQTVTRYLESASPPGGSSVTITFQPMTPTSLSKVFAVPVRAKDTSSTETATATLKMNDTTTIASRGPFTLTTTVAAVGGSTTTGSGSETAAITDHSKLSVVVVTT